MDGSVLNGVLRGLECISVTRYVGVILTNRRRLSCTADVVYEYYYTSLIRYSKQNVAYP